MEFEQKKRFLNYLYNYISPNKQQKFEEIVENRTKYLSVVLEDIFQPHNASAVIRSCECFGVQDLHIIENKYKYTANPEVTLGSSKWINLIKYDEQENNTLECIKKLKKDGYHIVATTLNEKSVPINEINLDQKVALLFGTELTGLSDLAISQADSYAKIPMVGFTQSFNISVTVALFLYDLTSQIRKSELNWQLSDLEKLETKMSWVKSMLKRFPEFEKRFLLEDNK